MNTLEKWWKKFTKWLEKLIRKDDSPPSPITDLTVEMEQ